MPNKMADHALGWLAVLSAAYTTQAENNSADNDLADDDLSTGQIVGITLGSLSAVIVILAIVSGCLSYCSTKKTKTTKTNADGSNETTETEERGSQEVAGKIANVAGTVAGEIGEVIAVVTHTTVTTAHASQNPTLSPSSAPVSYASTTAATVIDSQTVFVAIKEDIADGSSDGNRVAAAGLNLFKTQEILDQAAFLMAQSEKGEADVQATGFALHPPADHH